MEAAQGRFQHFLASLPRKPWCTDDLSCGIAVRPRSTAAQKAYVQPNAPWERRWLVMDVDRSDASMRAQDVNLPLPNLVAQNPENGHAHLFWRLETPVVFNAFGKGSPVRWLAEIERGFTRRLGADPSYTGLISKNPANGRWRTFEGPTAGYSLECLSRWLDPNEGCENVLRTHKPTGTGRNCSVYDALMTWAYAEYEIFAGPTFEDWFAKVLAKALKLNAFVAPLPYSEIKATAKSVAKWFWNGHGWSDCRRGRDGNGMTRHHEFDPASGFYLPSLPKLSAEETRERRVRSAENTHAQRRAATNAKIIAAEATIKAQGKKPTARAVASLAGVGIATAKRWKADQ